MYLLAQTLVVGLVFCQVAGLFDRWNGDAVGVLPPAGTSPSIYEVVIVEADGQRTEKMPAEVVNGLGLPVLQFGILPAELPEDPIRTRKARWQFNYLIQRPSETERVWASYPTTTPQAVAVAMVIWIIGLFLRNMAYAGSPLSIERQRAFLPKALTQPGGIAETGARGRKAPPPGRRRRGPRR